MISWRRPSDSLIEQLVAGWSDDRLSYEEVGQSRSNDPVHGYDNDFNRVRLGEGEAVYDAACERLRHWKMFPAGWTWAGPGVPPIGTGQTLCNVIRVFGLYWVNPCRIVYVLRHTEPVRRFGFAYGTLPGHVERGEERFCVEMLSDGSVWYDLRAFSRPRLWLVRLGYPMVRSLQRRFARESLGVMRMSVNPIEN